MHENRQEDDDWQRNANQPKQQSASETHDVLLGNLFVGYSTPMAAGCSDGELIAARICRAGASVTAGP